MSHFLVLVVADSEEQVDKLLTPYDENGEWFKDGSRWDWYQLGGRWTGYLDGYNPVLGRTIIDKVCENPPIAILSPDGAWHERERVGWFGSTIGPKEEDEVWKGKVREILTKNLGKRVFVVDCHV